MGRPGKIPVLLSITALGSLFGAPVLRAQQPPMAGTVNFVQGQATIDGQMLSSGADAPRGSRQLHGGETLATAGGSADLLLGAGSLLRVGDHASVRMVSADPHRVEVRLDQGVGNVSVHEVPKETLLLVDTPRGQTQILSAGLYTFNVETGTVRVFNGEAWTFPGTDTTADVKPVKIKEGHELDLAEGSRKPENFDRASSDGDLLPWAGQAESEAVIADSGLRRSDEAESYSGGGGGYPPIGSGFYGPYGYGYGAYGFGSPFYAGFGPGYGWGPYGFYGSPFYGGYGYGGYGLYGGGGYYRSYGNPGGLRGGRIPHSFPSQGGGFQGGHIPHGFSGNGGGLRSGGGGFHGGSSGSGLLGGGGGFHGGGGGRH